MTFPDDFTDLPDDRLLKSAREIGRFRRSEATAAFLWLLGGLALIILAVFLVGQGGWWLLPGCMFLLFGSMPVLFMAME